MAKGKIAAAVMTAVGSAPNSPKQKAAEIEKAMSDAVLQTIANVGWDDKAILDAKLKARQEVIDRWNSEGR